MSIHDSRQIENVKVMLVKGADGDNIASIEKTGTDVLVDTYTVTLTDGSKTTFQVTNGKGISSISKTGTDVLVDTYTITFNDGSTSTYTVTNGNGIASIEKTATDVLVDTYTITFTNGSSTTFNVTNGKGISTIEKTATQGLVDTYTITFNDGSTSSFTVTNGNIDIVNQNLANVEDTSTASQAYAVGDYLIFIDRFCKVTSAIAQGDTLAIGTNLDYDTVANELSRLHPIGDVIMSYTCNTLAKVKENYGGLTWVQITDRMPIGAGNAYAVGATGGATSQTYTPSGTVENKSLTYVGTVGDTTLTTDQIPSHYHTYGGGTGISWDAGRTTHFIVGTAGRVKAEAGITANMDLGAIGLSGSTGYTGGGKAHNHGFTGTTESHNHGFTGTQATINTLSPYIAVYIWRRTA